MMISGGLNKAHLETLKKTITDLALPPAKRRRLLMRIARHGIIVAAKRNQKKQQFPDGTPWPERKRGNRKLLQNLPKLLDVREVHGGEGVAIYLRSEKRGKKISAGALGYIHDTGATVEINAASLPPFPQEGKGATKGQARRLRKLNFKRRDNGRWVKASASWILEHLSRAQAGVIIREMSGEAPKNAWKIVVPSRVFLGVDDDEFVKILARQLQGLNYGGGVKPQDIKGKTQ